MKANHNNHRTSKFTMLEMKNQS